MDPEVLRGLHEPDAGVVQVGQRLGQEIRAGPEVGVEDDDVLAARANRGVRSGCPTSCDSRGWAAGCSEAKRLGSCAGPRVARPVVEHEGLCKAGIRVDQLEYAGPGVAEHLHGLAADRQEDVHCRAATGRQALTRSTCAARSKPRPEKFIGRLTAW